MSLPSTTPVWSRVEIKKYHLSSGFTVATIPTKLSPGADEIHRMLAAETSRRVRMFCDSAVANYLNQLPPERRGQFIGRTNMVRPNEVHHTGYAVIEVAPYCHSDDARYLGFTFYISRHRQIVTNGEQIDPTELRAALGQVVKTTTEVIVN